jgi:hypothetical protein
VKTNNLTQRPIERIAHQKVSFGFSEIRDVSFVKARNDSNFFIDYIHHLKSFCNMTWDEIRTTQRHGFGSETIGVNKLSRKALQRVPFGLRKLIVLRATGDNRVFLGYRDGNMFQILFIEYRFGDIYVHGA